MICTRPKLKRQKSVYMKVQNNLSFQYLYFEDQEMGKSSLHHIRHSAFRIKQKMTNRGSWDFTLLFKLNWLKESLNIFHVQVITILMQQKHCQSKVTVSRIYWESNIKFIFLPNQWQLLVLYDKMYKKKCYSYFRSF